MQRYMKYHVILDRVITALDCIRWRDISIYINDFEHVFDDQMALIKMAQGISRQSLLTNWPLGMWL